MVRTLRPARSDDAPALVDLAGRAWADVEASIDAILGSPLDRLATPSWPAHHQAVVHGVLEDPAASVVVAEDARAVITGFVASRVHPASAGMSAYGEVVAIAVDPGARGSGTGRDLLDRAVAELRAAGAPVIMLETGGDEGHAPARALYESAGFRRLPIAQYWLPGASAQDADGRPRTSGDGRAPPVSSRDATWEAGSMPYISYPDLDSLDPGDREIVEYGRTHSTPRPESQAIRAHVPAVLHAFTNAWRTTFLSGVLDHSIKELCRVYVSKSIQCEY